MFAFEFVTVRRLIAFVRFGELLAHIRACIVKRR